MKLTGSVLEVLYICYWNSCVELCSIFFCM